MYKIFFWCEWTYWCLCVSVLSIFYFSVKAHGVFHVPPLTFSLNPADHHNPAVHPLQEDLQLQVQRRQFHLLQDLQVDRLLDPQDPRDPQRVHLDHLRVLQVGQLHLQPGLKWPLPRVWWEIDHRVLLHRFVYNNKKIPMFFFKFSLGCFPSLLLYIRSSFLTARLNSRGLSFFAYFFLLFRLLLLCLLLILLPPIFQTLHLTNRLADLWFSTPMLLLDHFQLM